MSPPVHATQDDYGIMDTSVSTTRRGATRRASRPLPYGIVAAAAALVALAAVVIRFQPYTPRSGFAYVLGIIGGSLMLVLLLYPLRKRLRARPALGPMRYWFQMHMVCGVLGPVLILFHSTFRTASINATVAMACMLLVALSGIVGRFLYRRIHHGLYGHRATLGEMRADLAARLAALDVQVEPLPAVKRVVDAFATTAAETPRGARARAMHFVALGLRRRRAVKAVRALLTTGAPAGGHAQALQGLVDAVDGTFRSMQRAAQFERYERLFSLWHLAHVPFVYLFVLTAVVHVVAVHVY